MHVEVAALSLLGGAVDGCLVNAGAYRQVNQVNIYTRLGGRVLVLPRADLL